MGNVKDFIYGEKDLLKLDRKCLQYLDPAKFQSLQDEIRKKDKIRDQTSSRKDLHKAIDRKRNISSPRKKLQQVVDRVRDQKKFMNGKY